MLGAAGLGLRAGRGVRAAQRLHRGGCTQAALHARRARPPALQVYLNLVLEYVPDTVYRINKHYTKNEQRMPLILVKLYTYQVGGWVAGCCGGRLWLLARALALCPGGCWAARHADGTAGTYAGGGASCVGLACCAGLALPPCSPRFCWLPLAMPFLQMLRALAHIHAVGVCHRCVRPRGGVGGIDRRC